MPFGLTHFLLCILPTLSIFSVRAVHCVSMSRKTNAQRLQKRSDKIILRLDRRLKLSLRATTRFRHLFRRAATFVMAKVREHETAVRAGG